MANLKIHFAKPGTKLSAFCQAFSVSNEGVYREDRPSGPALCGSPRGGCYHQSRLLTGDKERVTCGRCRAKLAK